MKTYTALSIDKISNAILRPAFSVLLSKLAKVEKSITDMPTRKLKFTLSYDLCFKFFKIRNGEGRARVDE